MEITLTNIFGQIYFLKFPDQTSLCDTMLRFQEYYESPEFCGKFFSRTEFEDWYTKKNGAFTYLSDWTGFNVPDRAFVPFFTGLMVPLSKGEQQVLNLLTGLARPYYVIATADAADMPTMRHELAHGLYAVNPDYRAEVQTILEGVQLGPLHRYLSKSYHPSVWLDECHAYIGMNHDFLLEKQIITDDSWLETHKALAKAFDFYTENKFKVS